MKTSIIAGAILALAAATALAQPAAPAAPAPPATQPLVVERIHNGWLFSPDVRATDLDVDIGALAGGYVGRIHDNTWVIGGGGYVLANQDDDFNLWYAGPVVEYLVRADRRIGFGVRSLVGFGSATMPLPVSEVIDPRVLASSHRTRSRRGNGSPGIFPADAMVAVDDSFVVAEPQLNVMWNLNRGQRIVFGVGYRVTGNAPWLGDRLNGMSGSIAFQLGGGR
jgi:hypothetical protein